MNCLKKNLREIREFFYPYKCVKIKMRFLWGFSTTVRSLLLLTSDSLAPVSHLAHSGIPFQLPLVLFSEFCANQEQSATIWRTSHILDRPKSESGNKSLPCWANWFACCLWDGLRIESEIAVAADLGHHIIGAEGKKRRFTGDHLCGFPLHLGAKKIYSQSFFRC